MCHSESATDSIFPNFIYRPTIGFILELAEILSLGTALWLDAIRSTYKDMLYPIAYGMIRANIAKYIVEICTFFHGLLSKFLIHIRFEVIK